MRSALGQVQRDADKQGQGMGSSLAGGLKKTFAGGAVAVGAAGAAAMGTALTKGFQRLSAIDDAKGKLAGLGTSTQATAKIMDSALASVKGTAYGLGDAATVSASAVAAGIKPGQELTKYLTLTADAASIAGTSLGEMGSIFNKVQTNQVAFTDDLNMLADRGVPIYQWLQQEYKVSAQELRKMVEKGKVDSATFQKVIQKNIGGAAQSAGKTTRGALMNLQAALGRLGAAALGPSFARLPGLFASMTSGIDGATPAVERFAKALDAKVFGEWAPKIAEGFKEFAASDLAKTSLSRLEDVLSSLKGTALELAPAWGQILQSLAQASATLGVSTWQLFLAALEASAGALQAITPLVQGLASLMQDNQGAVTALMAAFLLFRTVPNIMGRVNSAIAPIATSAKTASSSLAGLATANRSVVQSSQMGAVQMGRFGSAVAMLGQSTPIVASMQSSFTNAAVGASRFGRTAGVAAAAGSGLKAAGAGIAGVFGGPVGLALTGAAALGTAYASSAADAAANAQQYQRALQGVSEAQKSMAATLQQTKGAVNTQVYAQMTDQVNAMRDAMSTAADRSVGFSDMLGNLGDVENTTNIREAAGAAQQVRDAFNQLGLTSEEMGRKVVGSASEFYALKAQLNSMGVGGQNAANELQKLRDTFEQQQDSARRLAPGVRELGVAMDTFADATSSAADKSNALKAALDALNPNRSKQETMAAHNKVMRDVAAATQEAIDKTQGFGAALIGAGGAVNTTTANGGQLYDALTKIVSATSDAASSGADMNQVNAKNQQAFQQLAQQYGLSAEQIRKAADTLGMDDIEVVVKLSGRGETMKGLAEIGTAFKNQPDKKTITVEAEGIARSRNELKNLGFDLKDVEKNGRKYVEVTAKTPEAKARLQEIISIAQQIPPGKAVNVSAPGGNQVLGIMSTLGVKVNTDNNKNIVVQSPLSQGVLDMLNAIGLQVETRNGKTVVVAAPEGQAVKQKLDDVNKSVETSNQKNVHVTDNGSAKQTQSTIDSIKGKTVEIWAKVKSFFGNATGGPTGYFAGGAVAAFAGGGGVRRNGAIRGAGTGTSDSISTTVPEGGHVLTAQEVLAAGGSDSISGLMGNLVGMPVGHAAGNMVPVQLSNGEHYLFPDQVEALGGHGAVFALRERLRKGLGAFATGGAVADSIIGVVKKKFPDATVNSALRPGDGGFHGIGKAVDFGGPMQQIADFLFRDYRNQLAQIIWNPGPTWFNVRRDEVGTGTVPQGVSGAAARAIYGEGTMAGHGDHVHAAASDPIRENTPPSAAVSPDPTLIPETPVEPVESTTTERTSKTTNPLRDSISDSFGEAAKSFVGGQLGDLLGVFGINDSPGALGAITEYSEIQRQKSEKDKADKDKDSKDKDEKEKDPEKLKESADKASDKVKKAKTAIEDKTFALEQAKLKRKEMDGGKTKPKASAIRAADQRIKVAERQLEEAKQALKDAEEDAKKAQQELDSTVAKKKSDDAKSSDPLKKVPGLTGSDAYAAATIRAAKGRGLPKGASVIGVATQLVEAGNPIKNFANSNVPESLKLPHDAVGSNGTSVGTFQQQNPWGPAAVRMDAFKAANLFFDRMPPNWQQMDPGAVAQSIQRSALPGKYGQQMAEAQKLVDRIGFRTGGKVKGKGGKYGDKIAARLSDQEFVTNADSANRAPNLLAAMNESPDLAGQMEAALTGPAAAAANSIAPGSGAAVAAGVSSFSQAFEVAAKQGQQFLTSTLGGVAGNVLPRQQAPADYSITINQPVYRNQDEALKRQGRYQRRQLMRNGARS